MSGLQSLAHPSEILKLKWSLGPYLSCMAFCPTYICPKQSSDEWKKDGQDGLESCLINPAPYLLQHRRDFSNPNNDFGLLFTRPCTVFYGRIRRIVKETSRNPELVINGEPVYNCIQAFSFFCNISMLCRDIPIISPTKIPTRASQLTMSYVDRA